MFGDTIDLAENKLLLLYLFREIKLPITKSFITEIVLQNNFINYFILQQYLAELISSSFITEIVENESSKLKISEKGLKVLDLFQNRISKDKKHTVDDYIKSNLTKIRNEISVTSDYTIESPSSYLVNLKVSENKITLLDLKISVPTNKQARDMCTKWKTNSSELYNNILSFLIKDN